MPRIDKSARLTPLGKIAVGKAKGVKVEVVTDAMGPQIIVKGNNLHLLSGTFPSHTAAIRMGRQIVKRGVGAYRKWRKPVDNMGAALYLFAMGAMSGWGTTIKTNKTVPQIKKSIRSAGGRIVSERRTKDGETRLRISVK